MRRERTVEKAAALVTEGKVAEVGEVRAFFVRGNSGHYLVTVVPKHGEIGTGLLPPLRSCTCTWGRSGHPEACSHLLAVSAIIRAEEAAKRTNPIEGLPA